VKMRWMPWMDVWAVGIDTRAWLANAFVFTVRGFSWKVMLCDPCRLFSWSIVFCLHGYLVMHHVTWRIRRHFSRERVMRSNLVNSFCYILYVYRCLKHCSYLCKNSRTATFEGAQKWQGSWFRVAVSETCVVGCSCWLLVILEKQSKPEKIKNL